MVHRQRHETDPSFGDGMSFRHGLAERVEIAHLNQLQMVAEHRRLLGHVVVHIERPPVVMAENTHAILSHHDGHLDGLHPVVQFAP